MEQRAQFDPLNCALTYRLSLPRGARDSRTLSVFETEAARAAATILVRHDPAVQYPGRDSNPQGPKAGGF